MFKMNKKDLQALIHLLDDPDNEVSDVVTGNLRKLGTEIIPDLETAWESSPDHYYQEKIENLIHDIQFSNIKHNLIAWKESGASDLMEGACWVARHQYPDLHTTEIKKIVDSIAKEIWLELSNKLTALEKVRIMNHIIFDVHKFSKNNKNIYSPRNSHINLVLESKKGNPVSLATVYILVAQKLKIPVYGVSLPKIFILAYVNEHVPLKRKTSLPDVLFYINPYTRGAVLGKKEIDHYLAQQKLEPQRSYYIPCSNEIIIQRLLLNLALSYEKAGFTKKLKDIQELLKIFDVDLTREY